MRLTGKNIVVYDCEIENEIDGQNITWSDHDKMGLSVACLYDYQVDEYKVFLREDIPALCDRLNKADLVVGFNTVNFDNRLLRALGGDLKSDEELKNYDIYQYSKLSVTGSMGGRTRGLKLDDHLMAIFGKKAVKTEDASQVPRMWKEGQQGRVISYCLSDVKRERHVFEHAAHKQWLATPEHGRFFVDVTAIVEVCQ